MHDSNSKWESHGSRVLQIWIPDDGGPDIEGRWTNQNSCIIHDLYGLFKTRIKLLERLCNNPKLVLNIYHYFF